MGSSKECDTLKVHPGEPCLSSSVRVSQTHDSQVRQPITVRQCKDTFDLFRLAHCLSHCVCADVTRKTGTF